MSLCPRCRRRVAKRPCPALGQSICQLCCGTLREKEVHCPRSCVHLAVHKSYQERRILEKIPAARPQKRTDGLDDQKMAWLAIHIEAAIMDYATAHREFLDRDVILALEYAREKTERAPARLIVPGASLRPMNEAGEAVLRAVEACRYQGEGLLATGSDTYKKAEKIACLERVALGIRLAADPRLEGRTYLQELEGRFAAAGADGTPKKLITLS